jgi:uncharacterized membrane protein YoaK (UPF0700 family)
MAYLDLASTTTAPTWTSPTPTFPAPEGIDVKCVLTIVFGCLSFVAASVTTAFYVRYREALRRPMLDCLILSIALAIPGSTNLVVGAVLRLHSAALKGYCSINHYFFQQFTLVEIMMEGLFFASIGWTLCGGTVTFAGVRRALVIFLIVGATAACIPMASLPINPQTGSVFGSDLPWCWLPQFDGFDDDGHPTSSGKLTAYKFTFGYMWAILSISAGLWAASVMIHRRCRIGQPLHPAVKWRFLYFGFFSVCWIICLIPRVFSDSLSLSATTHLSYVLAIVAPGMPFFNAVLFFVVEDVIAVLQLTAASGEQSVLAYDRMRVTEEDDSVVVDYDGDVSQSTMDTVQRQEASNHPRSPRSPRRGIEEALLQLNQDFKNAHAHLRPRAASQFRAKYDDDAQAWLVDVADLDLEPGSQEAGAHEEAIREFEATLGANQLIKRLSTLPKPPIGVALSFVAGYCDSCGFVSLSLFTAHVTGNIVLIGVHIANRDDVDTAEIWPNLVAIPVFCAAIAVIYTLTSYVGKHHRRLSLGLQLLCFTISFLVAKMQGPFMPHQTHSPSAYAAGMMMVAGMAIQNSYQRYHLVGLPMTTFMTGNTNQIVHDIIDIVRKRHAKAPKEQLAPVYTRFQNNSMCWSAFFIGVMMASLIYRYWVMWCFLPPVLLVIAIIVVFWDETAMPAAKK